MADVDKRGDDGFYEFPIVKVEWMDSFGSHGWEDREARLKEDKRSGNVRSVGFLIEKNAEWVRITPSITAGDNVECTLTIPRFAIKALWMETGWIPQQD